MVRVSDELALSPDEVTLYYTTDTFLANLPVLIFHGPSTTINSTLNSSRIQVHIFTGAGFQSYPRITISPNSPFYQSVNHLPRERQGDEICRGLAFALLKYFKELPEIAKSALIVQCANLRGKQRPGSAPPLFAEQHAADLAASMSRVENIVEILQDIQAALRPQNIHHIDVDLVLPPGSIAPFQEPVDNRDILDEESLDPTLKQYGEYAPLVKLFGETTFLPTSKLRRAPSIATSTNRSRTFLKDQKTTMRREMGELVDTEERYVIKMHELVNHIADDFRKKAKNRTFGSQSPSEDELEKLFPKALDRILQTNAAFLTAVKKVMDETEEEAMQDLEAATVNSTDSRYRGSGRPKDPSGALSFSTVLLEWFPRFADAYQEYIRASQEFPQIITSFVKQQSSFSQRIQLTGEQRLRSAVIEPVQRLPRYSLFIDNIVNCLPVLHPALQPMLKARDIITSICSMDEPGEDKLQLVNRMRNLIDSWPQNLVPQGRFIAAVDFIEALPPFRTSPASYPQEGMFLLFTDRLVILRKSAGSGLSARGLMAEVDKPSVSSMMANVAAAAAGQKKKFDLSFGSAHILGETRFTLSDDGRSVSMVSFHQSRDGIVTGNPNAPAATVRVFFLQGGYDGKGSKFTEEITKAKVEGRFSESERETDRWSLRSIKLPAADITVHAAIFEEGIDDLIDGRREPAPIRIVVDHHTGTKGAPVGHYGVEIVANVFTQTTGLKYRLEVDGLNDRSFTDEVITEYFLPTFIKRVNDLLRSQYDLNNPILTAPFICFYLKTVKSLRVHFEGDKHRSFRPASPVKLLSNFLSNGFSNSTPSSSASLSKHPKTPVMGVIPLLARSNSNKSTQSALEVDLRGSVRSANDSRPENPLIRLEETCAAYVAALRSRKGNVVGRTLRNRAMADELAINAIYNTLVENPFDQRTASEVTVDVLFVAFEKYLRMAWKDQMGDVVSAQTLEELQLQALGLASGDFSDCVRLILSEMSPQNRRALIAIVKLLADLLEGCGNDGDRGALTAAFAELLVVEGNPHDYINLLDRLVLDQEKLFEDIGPGAITDIGANLSSGSGSISAHRSNPSATGSVASNSSSFRKRFADTLLRQNSTSDRSSVWRTLSKSNRGLTTAEPSSQSSLSNSSVHRSRSTGSPGRRPTSRDRPTVLGAFEERPSSSSGPVSRLATIGASPTPEEKKEEKMPKKKRRSSLTDLKSLLAQATLGSPITPPATSPEGRKANTLRLHSSPRTPSPTKIPVAGGGIMDRPRSMIYHPASSAARENATLVSPFRTVGNLTERPQNIISAASATTATSTTTSEAVIIKDLWRTPPMNSSRAGDKKVTSIAMTQIPTLRGRPALESVSNGSPTRSLVASKSPQKLRLQSPQKLRERLHNEAKAINGAEEELQNELNKIGQEMALLHSTTSSTSRQTQAQDSAILTLQNSLTTLQSSIPALISDLTARNEAIQYDVEKSLQASAYKSRHLEQLHREATAENELLYERFNSELVQMVHAICDKGRDDNEALVARFVAATDEVRKVRAENSRLRREVVALKAALKAVE